MKIPEVLRIQVEHAPGSLAKVLDAVGQAGFTALGAGGHRSHRRPDALGADARIA